MPPGAAYLIHTAAGSSLVGCFNGEAMRPSTHSELDWREMASGGSAACAPHRPATMLRAVVSGE
eukprot:6829313-Prymnesium_polylepis.8